MRFHGWLSLVFVVITFSWQIHAASYNESYFIDPQAVTLDSGQVGIDLTHFVLSGATWGKTSRPYKRDLEFGGWIRRIDPSSCLNTRGQVLVRDSQRPVELAKGSCRVERGYWIDPYTNKDSQQARDLQIDHFVPLKNAYMSGAADWSFARRCLYANFLGASYHLIPVFGEENSRKGDRGPEGYLPKNRSYICQYLGQWLKIKYIWKLSLNADEKQAIEKTIQSEKCPKSDLTISKTEEESVIEFQKKNENLCGS